MAVAKVICPKCQFDDQNQFQLVVEGVRGDPFPPRWIGFTCPRCKEFIPRDTAERDYKVGDIASHNGDLRLIDNLKKFRSGTEQRVIDKLFDKLSRGDRQGLERSLRNNTVASLRRRDVLKVERT